MSWKTTLAAIFAVLVPILNALRMLWDGDPATVADWTPLAVALPIAIGLFSARDDDVTSEESGAQRKARKRQARQALREDRRDAGGGMPALIGLAAIALFLGAGAAGCGPVTTTSIDAAGQVKTGNQPDPVSVLRYDQDDRPVLLGKGPSVGSTISMLDQDGIWQVSPGLTGLLAYNPTTGQVYLSSPKDGSVGLFEVELEDGRKITLRNVELNVSEPLDRLVDAAADWAELLDGMTRTEAEKQVKQWQIAGEITTSMADLLLQTVVPHLPAPENLNPAN